MTDEEFIEKERLAWEKEVRFFSTNTEPERWVVREFLERLSISFTVDELISQREADDIDVRFRDANFQIKELYPEDYHRDSENKAALNRAQNAKVLSDLIPVIEAKDCLEVIDAYDRILEFAGDKRYTPASKRQLDLLVYVTRPGAGLNPQQRPPELAAYGWRSISCLYGENPYVLLASNDAPRFLSAAYANAPTSV